MSDRFISISRWAGSTAEWNDFVEAAVGGTLFHRLDFLDYHPAGRFDFHHLGFSHEGRTIGVMPGGLVTEPGSRQPLFASPLGASVGGPVFGRKLTLSELLATAEALQAHARNAGWSALRLTLPLAPAQDPPNQLLEFALHKAGFVLAERALCPVIFLATSAGSTSLPFSKTRRNELRKPVGRGIEVVEAGLDHLHDFAVPFAETYDRHGVAPTHTIEELRDLMTRFPDRIRVWLAMYGQDCIASVMLFQLSPHHAMSFYICSTQEGQRRFALLHVFAAMIGVLRERNVKVLELGPSASTKHINSGTLFFKESLGGQPVCRDTYVWRPTEDPR